MRTVDNRPRRAFRPIFLVGLVALFHAGARAPTEVVMEIREDADNLEVESRSLLRPVMLFVGVAFFLAALRGFRRCSHIG